MTSLHDRRRKRLAGLLAMLCVLPGAAGLALVLAGVSPDRADQAFLMRWWWSLLFGGMFVALALTRIVRR